MVMVLLNISSLGFLELETGIRDPTTGYNSYHCYKDVTSLVQTTGNGTYTLADAVLETGSTNLFGGWTLVIAFKN